MVYFARKLRCGILPFLADLLPVRVFLVGDSPATTAKGGGDIESSIEMRAVSQDGGGGWSEAATCFTCRNVSQLRDYFERDW